jgi:hypothetical protein
VDLQADDDFVIHGRIAMGQEGGSAITPNDQAAGPEPGGWGSSS